LNGNGVIKILCDTSKLILVWNYSVRVTRFMFQIGWQLGILQLVSRFMSQT